MRNGEAPEQVLVMGDDMRIFLAVVRSLGRAGKEVHAVPFNWHSPALRSKYVAKAHRLPRYAGDPEGWRAAMRALLGAHRFRLIVPCDDRAIHILNAHRHDFEDQTLAIPQAQAMVPLFDKEQTRRLAEELGIPVAAGIRLGPNDTAEGLAGLLGLPLVIKAKQSYSMDRLESVGKVWILDDEPALRAVLGDLRDPSRFLAEGYFEGVGVGVSVLAREGNILHAFQHRRLRQGRGGSSSLRISEAVDSSLLDACQKIAARVGLTGVCMFEFRFNPDTRRWILLETNARFWGSIPLPLSLGVDFPLFLYDMLVHGRDHAPVQYATGIRSRNFVLDGFNLANEARGLTPRRLGGWFGDLGDFLGQPIRWARGTERSDSLVADDPRPAFRELVLVARNASEKLTRARDPEPKRRWSDQGA